MTLLTYITTAILLLIALLHFLWGIDIYWPASDEASLARMVVGAKGITQMPNFWACVFVVICLLIGAVIVLRLGGVIAWSVAPLWLFRLAGAGFALVLLSRGIMGFLPFWAELSPEEPFRTLDRRYYSPLCIGLGLAVASLVFQAKSLSPH